MSDKDTVREAADFFKRVRENSETLHKKSGFDKQLSEKIRRVGEGAHEIVKHIEHKSGSQTG